jgi:hypothetical protein
MLSVIHEQYLYVPQRIIFHVNAKDNEEELSLKADSKDVIPNQSKSKREYCYYGL